MSNWTREHKLSLANVVATVIVGILVGLAAYFQQELRRAAGLPSQPEIKPVGSPTKQSPRSEPTTNPSPMPTPTNESAATEPIPNQGWAYYGFQDEQGRWMGRNFKKALGNPVASPQVGDIVIAIRDVPAREGYKEFEESVNDWVNKPEIGLIKPNVRLRVVYVYVIQDGFIWIEFARVD